MSDSVREHLLGYLLDALEPEEVAQVEEALAADPTLQGELDRLAAHLRDLDCDREWHAPPAGLAVETCRWIAIQLEEDTVGEAFDPPNSHSAGRIPAHSGTPAATPQFHPISTRDVVSFRHWSFADFFVAAGILLAASFLFVPALAHSRFDAQRQACQNNLRQVGLALAGYADLHGGFFPQIPLSGNRSFAGIFAPVLREGQFLPASLALSCPSSDVARRSPWRIPTLSEIDAAREEQLVELRQSAGGGYGYNVGWMAGDEYRGPRNLRRQWFALVADSPGVDATGLRSDNHAGRGINVLYDDLHFGFQRRCAGADCVDELFLNRNGRIAPGVDEDDAVIVRSETQLTNLLKSR
ncbi:MAG: hypothetical protein U0935_19655 [Pirellulales bacterium]